MINCIACFIHCTDSTEKKYHQKRKYCKWFFTLNIYNLFCFFFIYNWPKLCRKKFRKWCLLIYLVRITMGFEIKRFQGDVDEELICPICSGVLEDPLQVCGLYSCTKLNKRLVFVTLLWANMWLYSRRLQPVNMHFVVHASESG